MMVPEGSIISIIQSGVCQHSLRPDEHFHWLSFIVLFTYIRDDIVFPQLYIVSILSYNFEAHCKVGVHTGTIK